MADLLAILSQGASSLGAQRVVTATASHNLENVNTPGYSRQTAELQAVLPAETMAHAFVGQGVSIDTVRQARDRFIEAQIPQSIASAAQSSAESEALSSLSALDPDLTGGMTQALSGFFSGLSALSQNPGSAALRQGAVDAARELGRVFNSTAQSVATSRSGLDQEVSGLVQNTNDLAAQMASLNGQIRQARASGAEPNDLLDARTSLQDKLSALTGATPVPNSRGDVNMVLEGGLSLVSEDRAAQLSTRPDATNDGHLSLQATLADGTGQVSLPSVGGSLGGYLDARDGALRTAATSLDNLAFDLAGHLNTIHRAGYALDGSTGHDLFDVGATSPGAASRMTVSADVGQDPGLLSAASSSATVPGDASNVFQLIDVATTPFSDGKDPTARLAQIISDYGASTQTAKAFSEHESALRDHLQQMRESTSGVSIDEEMVNMTRAQRAYEAVTKVISTANQMLETLMNLK